MEQKFRFMKLYVAILFVVVILLILITSFSNSELYPSYEIENEETQYQVTFNQTMEQSVKSLTESNQKLNDSVKELEEKIKSKDEQIQKLNSKDENYLDKAITFYLEDNVEDAKATFALINADNLKDSSIELYNKLALKLK